MRIDIITIFPQMFNGPFDQSIIHRAKQNQLVNFHLHDLRKWTSDIHKTVDDRPYGGGAGMVMMIEPIYKAVESIKSESTLKKSKIILTSAKGTQFSQSKAAEYAALDQLIIICGHYEGVDQRVADHIADEEISIGNFVLTGGELPAMVITDSIVRLLPGVLGNPNSLAEESFSSNISENSDSKYITEYPHYTRPETFQGWTVPQVLLSGDHAKIKKWRQDNSS
jgi:tRNA (guanine37-N1)-methyltransferase